MLDARTSPQLALIPAQVSLNHQPKFLKLLKMGCKSPSKVLRSIKRMTRYAEKKHQELKKMYVLSSVSLPQIDIYPNYPNLSISRVQTTNILPLLPPKPNLSITHVQTTTVPPQYPTKPKLSIRHVETTTVPPWPNYTNPLRRLPAGRL